MKRKLFTLFLLGFGIHAFAQTSPASSSPASYKEIGSVLPSFKLVNLKGKAITNKDVKDNANLLVMLFNPNCSHCEDETALLEKNIDLFKKSKLLMVANNNMKEFIPPFEKSFTTAKYKPIILTIDSLGMTEKLFLYQGLPQINVYNKERKLIKVFSGEIFFDSLKNYIQ